MPKSKFQKKNRDYLSGTWYNNDLMGNINPE